MMTEPNSDDYKHAHSVLQCMIDLCENVLRDSKAVYDDPAFLVRQERLTKAMTFFQQEIAERI